MKFAPLHAWIHVPACLFAQEKIKITDASEKQVHSYGVFALGVQLHCFRKRRSLIRVSVDAPEGNVRPLSMYEPQVV